MVRIYIRQSIRHLCDLKMVDDVLDDSKPSSHRYADTAFPFISGGPMEQWFSSPIFDIMFHLAPGQRAKQPTYHKYTFRIE